MFAQLLSQRTLFYFCVQISLHTINPIELFIVVFFAIFSLYFLYLKNKQEFDRDCLDTIWDRHIARVLGTQLN